MSILSAARRLTIAASLVLVASSALAALPPEYQRMAELKAIIAAAEAEGVAATVGPITAIEYVSPDRYQIRSDSCVVVALIVSTPQKGPPLVGPRQFEVRLQPAACQ